MTDIDLDLIVAEVNRLALERGHPIGELQAIRKEMKGLQRLPSRDIFTAQSTFDDWAFHLGGRQELQFNIGIEDWRGIDELRYGVAFSLETSRTLPSIKPLIPKVKRFNEYIPKHLEEYADMRMWHYYMDEPSPDYMPSPIPYELIEAGEERKKVFIFLGKRQPISNLDYDILLNDLDRLLPLYMEVENIGSPQVNLDNTTSGFIFRPGNTAKVSSAKASYVQREIDIQLRHHTLQEALFHRLEQEYGAGNVGTENSCVTGEIDVVVKCDVELRFYEIKTASSPRACLREALGQLLEYGYWPGSEEPTHLIVVGEAPLDKEGRQYLRRLREHFSLPIEYEQITL